MTLLNICPCDSGEIYQACCEPYHSGQLWPRTALSLMRSRYSAYALGKSDYLLKTWLKTTRPGDFWIEKDLFWQSLEIVSTTKGQVRDSKGVVHFKAHYHLADGEVGCLEEVSLFKKDAKGHWGYLSGDEL